MHKLSQGAVAVKWVVDPHLIQQHRELSSEGEDCQAQSNSFGLAFLLAFSKAHLASNGVPCSLVKKGGVV